MDKLALIKHNQVHYDDPTLESYTQAIYKAEALMENTNLGIAHILHTIYKGELYKAAGCKTIYEYGEQAFGYKRANTNDFVRIGEYVEAVKDETTGKVKYFTCFAKDGKDFTSAQLAKALTLKEKLPDYIESGEITTDMSCRDIIKKSKELRNKSVDMTVQKNEPESELDQLDEKQPYMTEKEFLSDIKKNKFDKERFTGHVAASVSIRMFKDIEQYIPHMAEIGSSIVVKKAKMPWLTHIEDALETLEEANMYGDICMQELGNIKYGSIVFEGSVDDTAEKLGIDKNLIYAVWHYKRAIRLYTKAIEEQQAELLADHEPDNDTEDVPTYEEMLDN